MADKDLIELAHGSRSSTIKSKNRAPNSKQFRRFFDGPPTIGFGPRRRHSDKSQQPPPTQNQVNWRTRHANHNSPF